ncbi:MAG: hypothetical protein QM778_39050 [Myxococcales bacterium]
MVGLLTGCSDTLQSPPEGLEGTDLDAAVADASATRERDADLDERDASGVTRGDGSPDPANGSGEPADGDDAGEEDPADRDAGGKVCDDGWVEKGAQCVPACQPLPDAFTQARPAPTAPPFGNTVWFDPDVITKSDPTSFVDVVSAGTGKRNVFDRRTDSYEQIDAILFKARFGSATEVEVRVNPEFSHDDAEAAAIRHAIAIGRIPAFLFASLKTITIHKGKELYGGGGNDLLIHTGQTDDYEADGVLEEVFLHEATHTSLDGQHAAAANWRAAQTADGVAISPYAQENPTREDLAETMGPYLAIRFRRQRLKVGVVEKFEANLPNRMKYLDCLGLTMDTLK